MATYARQGPLRTYLSFYIFYKHSECYSTDVLNLLGVIPTFFLNAV